MKIKRLSLRVNFDLSFLKIRWSNRVLITKEDQVLGEGVVYGGDWAKAEKLARQMAKIKFGSRRGKLPVCEQVFIARGSKHEARSRLRREIKAIIKRRSNLKVKVGRNVFQDIKVLQYIKEELKFPNEIRIDANQGYSLKQLQYLIPTLKEAGVRYVEEPVKKRNLPQAVKLLHQYGLRIILDETLQTKQDWHWGTKNKLLDAVNIKLSRIGDINQSLQYIKLAKKQGIKVIIGCSEELERGMEAIYALGHKAKKQGVLLDVEGDGDLRLKPFLKPKTWSIPRWLNRLENLSLILKHRVRQALFDLCWSLARLLVFLIKKTKLLSSLSLRLVKLTGKHRQKIHPKHLIAQKYPPAYMEFINNQDVVLDIGCGNGQHSLRLAKRAKQVIGFDTDQQQLALAKALAKEKNRLNVIFRQLSAEERLDFKTNTFSRVLFLGVLEHLKNRDQILAEAYRVLTPRGLLLLGVPHEMTGWKKLQLKFGILHYTDPDHQIEYTRESITGLLESQRFRIKEVQPTAYDTPWAGMIDVIGGISLSLYERLIQWKWRMARKHPEESISFFIVAEKAES